MKTWNELSEYQQSEALEHITNMVLQEVIEYGIPDPEIQEKVEEAGLRMERMQTPWFIGEALWESDWVRKWIQDEAQILAEASIYLEDGETAFRLPDDKKEIKYELSV